MSDRTTIETVAEALAGVTITDPDYRIHCARCPETVVHHHDRYGRGPAIACTPRDQREDRQCAHCGTNHLYCAECGRRQEPCPGRPASIPRSAESRAHPPVADQVTLNRLQLTRDGIRVAARDVRALHSVIEWAADRDHDCDTRTLWVRAGVSVVVVQSAGPLDPARLSGLAEITSHAVQSTHHEMGATVEVSTICNPVRKHGNTHRPVFDADRAPWLDRKLGDCLTLHDVRVEALAPIRVPKPDRVATFRPVGYHAIGTVTNPDLLAGAQSVGIGQGKAYGLGLLLVSEVSL